MKSTIPALVCMLGLLYCSWQVYLSRPQPQPHYSVEITVHGPDGKTIPIVAPRQSP